MRAAALHVEQDACLIEELEARLDQAAEQGRRYSDPDWVQTHRRRQATGYWLPLWPSWVWLLVMAGGDKSSTPVRRAPLAGTAAAW